MRIKNKPYKGNILRYAGNGEWEATTFSQRPRQDVHTETTIQIVLSVWRSPNFVSGSDGWQIEGDGSAEFNDITARGTIYASAGEIGGWTIAAGHLYSGAGANRTGLRPADYPFYAGAVDPATAPFSVTPAGALKSTSGEIGGWTINATELRGTNCGLDSGNQRFWINTETFGNSGFVVEHHGGQMRFHIGNVVTGKYLQFEDGDLVWEAGNSSLDDSGNLTATNVDLTGEINAETGSIGGWTIVAGHLYSGAGANRTGLRPADYPFYAGAEDPATAPFRVTPAGALVATSATIEGEITATTGEIGGWTITATELHNTDIWLDAAVKQIAIKSQTYGNAGIQAEYNAGSPRFYVGDGANKYVQFDGTNLSWKGVNTELTAGGAFTATNATITGTITATAGQIGGWAITATELHNTNIWLDAGDLQIAIKSQTFGNDGIQLEYNAGTPRFYVGDGANKYVQFDGTNLSWKGANAELTAAGNLVATGGTIGGWTLGLTSLSSANITLDAALDRITVGGITIQGGASPEIESSTYASGTAGFHIDEDFAEFGNVQIRGAIGAMVLKYQEVTAVGGSFIVAVADTLTEDAAAGQNKLQVETGTRLQVGDDVQLSEGGTSETRTISGISIDGEITLTANLTFAWKAGAAVVKWEQRILLTSELANSPYISIVNAAGTEKARMGNLDGLAGDPTGYGLWSDNVFLEGKIVAESGEIGGWTITSTQLHSTNIWLDADDKLIGIGAFWYGLAGIQLDYNAGSPRAYIGDGANKYVQFDGTDLSWKGVNTELTAGGAFTATNATITGTVTADAGEIGGWSITANNLGVTGKLALYSQDVAPGPFIWLESSTWGHQGIQLQYNAGSPRLYVGDGANKYVKFDGTNLSWKGANTELTAAGDLTATNATITGTIYAEDGEFQGVLTISAAGEIRQGTGTLGVDYTGLRVWNDGGVGRIAGYDDDTLQWYTNASGQLLAGGGQVTLDDQGITLTAGTNEINYLKWYHTGNLVASVYGHRAHDENYFILFMPTPSAQDKENFVMFQAISHANSKVGYAYVSSLTLYSGTDTNKPFLNTNAYTFGCGQVGAQAKEWQNNYFTHNTVSTYSGGGWTYNYRVCYSGSGGWTSSGWGGESGGYFYGGDGDNNYSGGGAGVVAVGGDPNGPWAMAGAGLYAEPGTDGANMTTYGYAEEDFRTPAIYAQGDGIFYGRIGVGEKDRITPGDAKALLARVTIGMVDGEGGGSYSGGFAITGHSDDVAHALTHPDYTPGVGDEWFWVRKLHQHHGGVLVEGATEDGWGTGMYLDSYVQNEADIDTTTTSGSVGAQVFRVSRSNGVNQGQNLSSTRNGWAWRNWGRTSMVLKANGQLHLDISVTHNSWDEYDDLALIEAVRDPRGLLQTRTREFIEQHREILEKTGVFTFNEDGHHFLCVQNWTYLLADALRQVAGRLEQAEDELKQLRLDNSRIRGMITEQA